MRWAICENRQIFGEVMGHRVSPLRNGKNASGLSGFHSVATSRTCCLCLWCWWVRPRDPRNTASYDVDQRRPCSTVHVIERIYTSAKYSQLGLLGFKWVCKIREQILAAESIQVCVDRHPSDHNMRRWKSHLETWIRRFSQSNVT